MRFSAEGSLSSSVGLREQAGAAKRLYGSKPWMIFRAYLRSGFLKLRAHVVSIVVQCMATLASVAATPPCSATSFERQLDVRHPCQLTRYVQAPLGEPSAIPLLPIKAPASLMRHVQEALKRWTTGWGYLKIICGCDLSEDMSIFCTFLKASPQAKRWLDSAECWRVPFGDGGVQGALVQGSLRFLF